VAVLLVHARREAVSARRTSAAVAVLALAALVKFVAIVPLVLLIAADVGRSDRGTRLRRAMRHVALAAGIGAGGYLPFAQTHDLTFGLAYLFPFGSLVSPMLFVNNTVVSAVGSTLGPDASLLAGGLVRLSFAAAFAVVFVRLVRSTAASAAETQTIDVSSWGWALVLVSLSFQWLYPWYVAWFAPLAWTMSRRVRGVAVALSAALPLSTITVNYAAAPVVTSGLWRLCFYVMAPILLVVLVRLLLDARKATGSQPNAALAPAAGDV
jgi:hypothetical protein